MAWLFKTDTSRLCSLYIIQRLILYGATVRGDGECETLLTPLILWRYIMTSGVKILRLNVFSKCNKAEIHPVYLLLYFYPPGQLQQVIFLPPGT